jgi:ribosomal protein L12E/L44/L45/RPP1/RPP2
LQIFEAIVEKQIMDTSISQVKRLEKNIENVMVSQVAPQAPIAPAPESVEEPKEEPAEEPRQEPAEEQTQEPSPAPAQSPVKQNSNEKSSI